MSTQMEAETIFPNIFRNFFAFRVSIIRRWMLLRLV